MKSGYISIIGKPNSGKSTLLNYILGEQLSIVTHKAQTTRHKIVGIHNVPGAQMVFFDTPGYHESQKTLNKYMNEQVKNAVKDADVVCWVVDLTEDRRQKSEDRGQKTEGEKDLSPIIDRIDRNKIILVLNKIDTVIDSSWQGVVDEFKTRYLDYEIAAVSAKTGFGINELINKLVEKLPEGEALYPDDIYTEHPVRFLVSEIIREQAFLLLHEELPYSTAVEIEQYKEEEKIHRIHASIIVEKESQKGMVIGAGGRMIKMIGQAARAKIEALVGVKVFLKLFVKVEKNWTKDERIIKKIL